MVVGTVPAMAVIFDTASSLNGFLADSEDSLDWLFAIPGEAPDMDDFLASVTVVVAGSSTYEWLLEHEDALGHPETWPQFFGDRPLFVFSSRELPVPEGADVRVVSGPVTDHLPAIRQATGDGDIWMLGGGELAAQFLAVGALDRVAISFAPVFLQAGKPLFAADVTWDRLRLRSAEKIGEFARVVYDITPAGR